jgi:hypothetical protein
VTKTRLKASRKRNKQDRRNASACRTVNQVDVKIENLSLSFLTDSEYTKASHFVCGILNHVLSYSEMNANNNLFLLYGKIVQ